MSELLPLDRGWAYMFLRSDLDVVTKNGENGTPTDWTVPQPAVPELIRLLVIKNRV
jgi:hypothetical protein